MQSLAVQVQERQGQASLQKRVSRRQKQWSGVVLLIVRSIGAETLYKFLLSICEFLFVYDFILHQYFYGKSLSYLCMYLYLSMALLLVNIFLVKLFLVYTGIYNCLSMTLLFLWLKKAMTFKSLRLNC